MFRRYLRHTVPTFHRGCTFFIPSQKDNHCRSEWRYILKIYEVWESSASRFVNACFGILKHSTCRFRPVPLLPNSKRKQPKHKKAARRYRRREMLQKRDNCQEEPLRLAYFVSEPRASPKQLRADAVRQKAANFIRGTRRVGRLNNFN